MNASEREPTRRRKLEKLVEAWQRGADREGSFRRIFDELSAFTFGFFRKRGFSLEQCDDLVQETFLAVYQGLDRFRGEVPFDIWLFEIATNVYRRSLRRRSTQKRAGHEVSLDDPVDDLPALFAPPTALRRVLAREELHEVSEALEDCPAQMRRCMLLSWCHGYSHGQIASVLQISPATVKVQLFRARRRLRKSEVRSLELAKA